MSQSLWNRAVSSDFGIALELNDKQRSQSLWNRAVSSDLMDELAKIASNVSIPLEQGSVFRLSNREEKVARLVVSIPLEQGSVFRQIASQLDEGESLSQSLWNRAVSSDEEKQAIKYRLSLNPFGTGQCLPTEQP